MVRRSCGSLDRDGAGTDRGGEIIACRGVRTGNRGLRQGRAHALRAAAERRILQTPRQGEEQQDQCQLNSLLHPVRIINFYAAKIHSFTQKSTLANQKDHKMTNFESKSTTNPQNGQISVVVLTIRLFFVSVRPVEAFEWPAGGIVERGLGFQNVTLFGNASHFIKR